jgi:copper chaperone CopZ
LKFRGYLIIVLALLFSNGCVSTKQLQSDSTTKYETRVYEVYGMDCPGCHDGVEKLVNKVPGVHDSEADWEKARLEVSVKPGSDLSDEAIYEAVRKANFTPGKRIK